MKTIKQQVKSVMLILALLFSINVIAQKEVKKNDMFVRVYNLEGKKINKGIVFTVTDTTLQLKRNGRHENILFSSIGLIKTKHSEGHNVLMGSVIGASSMALLGAASADPDAMIFGYSAGEGAAAGGVLGGISGAAIGGITILFKNSKSYLINGDLSKWKAFQEMITKKRIE